MSEKNTIQKDFVIRSESIQRIYNFYRNKLFLVNRRYQRKLIWTVEEKRALIDSIIKAYPIPLILLSETKQEAIDAYELIDGMQRINAIVAFIENEFDINGFYFDLDTMVESKSASDSGELFQKEPKMDRVICEKIASYIIPLSVFPYANKRSIDELFIRINSYGRHLSRQELRSAGTLGEFADNVRFLANQIRSDVSNDDVLLLNMMKQISITNIGLDYGIPIESIFWVSNNIITKDMVRESRDEEIIADILATMIYCCKDKNNIPATSSQVLDELYGLRTTSKTAEFNYLIKTRNMVELRHHFIKTYDELRKILSIASRSFADLIYKGAVQRLPRYFQIVFLALYRLICIENLRIISYPDLIKSLDGIFNNINITDGGNWSADNRKTNINSVCGIISHAFVKNTDDPGNQNWITEFESLLMQSKTEQSLFDFKQGFLLLDGTNKFDDNSFSKIIKTLTAMANISPNCVGYVCVGVCDKAADAARIRTLHGVSAIVYRDYRITGINHEINILGKSTDAFFQQVVQKIELQPMKRDVIDSICANTRTITYQGRDIVIFKIVPLPVPVAYNGKYYIRHGANVSEILTDDYPTFFSSYAQARR